MFTITRRLAGQLKTVFRRALHPATRGVLPPVLIGSSPAGFCIQCRTAEAAAEYRTTDDPPEETLCVPFELLADCEGGRQQPVTLQQQDHCVVAHWQDGSVPQIIQHPVPQPTWEDWPAMPERLAENPPRLLTALEDARQTTDPDSARYSLGCVQIQGTSGKLLATDGRQLLVQSGFTFPWEEDVLVPASRLFGSKQLPHDEPVLVGRSENWLVLRVGFWTFHLRLNLDGRFPKVEDHIQRADNAVASFLMQPEDRAFLIENLPRLPGDDAMNYPVTVDLNGQVTVRAKAEGQPTVTELLLAGATRTGEPLRINTNRRYLTRAARLGFARLHVFSPKAPVLCQDEHRQYVWALCCVPHKAH